MKNIKQYLISVLVALVLLGPGTVRAGIDLQNIEPAFRFLGNHVFGFDFDDVIPNSKWQGEIRGVYSHTIIDTAAGWVLSAVGITVGDVLDDGTLGTDCSGLGCDIDDLACGVVYPVNPNVALEVNLVASPTEGCSITFCLVADATATEYFLVDVTSYAFWGTDDLQWVANAGDCMTLTAVGDSAVAEVVKWVTDRPLDFETYGDVAILNDNKTLSLGIGSDFSCTHTGTNTECTSATGDFLLDNTSATGATVMRLGTDTSATDFLVRNNSTTIVFDVDGTGAASFPTDDVNFGFGSANQFIIKSITTGASVALTAAENLLLSIGVAAADTVGDDIVVRAGQGGASAAAAAGDGGPLNLYGGAGGTGLTGVGAAGAGGAAALYSGNGGDAAGDQNAGIGGTASLLAGDGGDAGAAGAAGTSAAGGRAAVTGGVGGAANDTVSASDGGAIAIDGGAGGAAASFAGAGGVGGDSVVKGGAGGASSTAGGGGAGGASSLVGGAGGIGDATPQDPGVGGQVNVTGGAAGGDGGSGANIDGGDVVINGGAAVNAGTAGKVHIGSANTEKLDVDVAAEFAALVTAALGLDVTTAALTAAAGFTVSGGAIDLDPTTTVDLSMDAGQAVSVHVDDMDAALVIEAIGGEDLLVLNYSAGTKSIILGNAADNPLLTQLGTGQVSFAGNVDAANGLDVSVADVTLAAGLDFDCLGTCDIGALNQGTAGVAGFAVNVFSGAGGVDTGAAAGGIGGALSINSGAGGLTTSAQAAGAGAALTITSGVGGAGSATGLAGAAGALNLYGGNAGADGGAGGGADGASVNVYAGDGTGTGNGGHVVVNAGPSGAGGGVDGDVRLGAADTAQVEVCNAVDNPPFVQFGSGQVTFNGNLDAAAGLDVTSADITLANALDFDCLGQCDINTAVQTTADTAGYDMDIFAGYGGAGTVGGGGVGGAIDVDAGAGGSSATLGVNAGVGGAGSFHAGTGGATTNTGNAGAGGAMTVASGNGGAGAVAGLAGAAGTLSLLGGNAGAEGGGGGGNDGGSIDITGGDGSGNGDGGHVTINGGPEGVGAAGVDGDVRIGAAETEQVEVCNATDNPAFVQLGTGQVTFNGNVDAALGLDVTGDFSYSGHKNSQTIVYNDFVIDVPAPGAWQFSGGALSGDGASGALAGDLAYCNLDGLKIGDEIVSFVLYGIVNEAVTVTLDAGLFSVEQDGSETAILDDTEGAPCAMTQISTNVGPYSQGDICTDVAGYTTVAADTRYIVKFTATAAGAGDVATVQGVEVVVNRK